MYVRWRWTCWGKYDNFETIGYDVEEEKLLYKRHFVWYLKPTTNETSVVFIIVLKHTDTFSPDIV